MIASYKKVKYYYSESWRGSEVIEYSCLTNLEVMVDQSNTAPVFVPDEEGGINSLNGQSKARQMLKQLQQAVSYLNNIGMDLLQMDKLKSAAHHFNMALEKLQVLSHIKRKIINLVESFRGSASPDGQDASSPVNARKRGRPCEPLTIDESSSALSFKWEILASLVLIHNAALVHFRRGAPGQSVQMLKLALGILKKEISPVELNSLLRENSHAANVVVTVYTTLGKVNLSMSSTPGCDHDKEAKRAVTVASGLIKRFLTPNDRRLDRNLPSTQKSNSRETDENKEKVLNVSLDETITSSTGSFIA